MFSLQFYRKPNTPKQSLTYSVKVDSENNFQGWKFRKVQYYPKIWHQEVSILSHVYLNEKIAGYESGAIHTPQGVLKAQFEYAIRRNFLEAGATLKVMSDEQVNFTLKKSKSSC